MPTGSGQIETLATRTPQADKLRTSRANARTFGSAAATTLLLGSALLLLGACSDPLLGPKDERSPFDRYDAVRNQHAPQYIEDKFGRRQPNLSGRLGPKD